MEEERIKSEDKAILRDEKGLFLEGTAPGPGRPKGETLKEFARNYYMLKTDEEKRVYIEQLEAKIPGFAWRMAEGNPHNTEDITSKGEKIIPIYAGSSLQGHDGDAPSVPNEEKN